MPVEELFLRISGDVVYIEAQCHGDTQILGIPTEMLTSFNRSDPYERV